jgi:alanyl-tRNA synthetase
MTRLPDLIESSRVTFPQGAASGVGTVLYTEGYGDDTMLVITDETPFYPLSHTWPDQCGDVGEITVDDDTIPVIDTLTAATDPERRRLYIDTEIPVRKFESGWLFFVAHVIPAGPAVNKLPGRQVQLAVEPDRRRSVSATHTSTHLAGLAMNKATADLWRKDVERDGLGHPDLDRLAMARSSIGPGEAVDRYRFGKSLRKKGFASDMLFERLTQLTEQVNRQVAEWLATEEPVTIMASDPSLAGARLWTCHLDGTLVEFRCGGTHVGTLAELHRVEVSYDPHVDDQEIVMRTRPTLRS